MGTTYKQLEEGVLWKASRQACPVEGRARGGAPERPPGAAERSLGATHEAGKPFPVPRPTLTRAPTGLRLTLTSPQDGLTPDLPCRMG